MLMISSREYTIHQLHSNYISLSLLFKDEVKNKQLINVRNCNKFQNYKITRKLICDKLAAKI